MVKHQLQLGQLRTEELRLAGISLSLSLSLHVVSGFLHEGS